MKQAKPKGRTRMMSPHGYRPAQQVHKSKKHYSRKCKHKGRETQSS